MNSTELKGGKDRRSVAGVFSTLLGRKPGLETSTRVREA